MKRILLLALALAMLTLSAAFAEESAPYACGSFEITLPGDVVLEEYDASVTAVRGMTRVVIQVIPQELAEDGQAQVRALMTVYDEATAEIVDVPLVSGVYGAMGLIENCFGDGVHQIPVLILKEGELLILSGYNDDGDTLAVHTLIAELLSGVVLAGEHILPSATVSIVD